MKRINKKSIEKIASKYRGKEKVSLLSILQEIQTKYNYLPKRALEMVCELLDVPKSKIYGLATFYTQFSMKERGKYLIRICEGTACHAKGSQRIKELLKKTFGLQEGETTPDKKFTLQIVACVGSCFLSPVMMVDSTYYGNLTPEKATNILKELK
ncbi:MAG TPA: NADH-quinone oxidoreductase subunit NuoE [Candidatus Omnitrophica bacterium]|nr:NADH-quinone oxidoreductase subunit NuoE [Candidatus Omnitrophota bacterium]